MLKVKSAAEAPPQATRRRGSKYDQFLMELAGTGQWHEIDTDGTDASMETLRQSLRTVGRALGLDVATSMPTTTDDDGNALIDDEGETVKSLWIKVEKMADDAPPPKRGRPAKAKTAPVADEGNAGDDEADEEPQEAPKKRSRSRTT